ncbi:MAG: glycoside hydrolase family protein [Rickettsiales bacterium]|nr:glycoside hydrolase family protein [Rickettsiales bacterium]
MRSIVKKQLKRHEGLRLKPYKCTADKLTIGYGRNLDDVGITEKEADKLLDHDIDRSIDDTRALFPDFDELSEIRQAVLVNMMFNLGKTRLSKFVKMRDAIEDHDYNRAAKEMLDSKWADQVGNRAVELAELMRGG